MPNSFFKGKIFRFQIQNRSRDKMSKSKSPAASETLDTLMEISRLLNTGLDEETMAICIRLCENGINPESLAQVIKELKREAANLALETSENNSPPSPYSR